MTGGIIFAKINRPRGIIQFKRKEVGNQVLESWNTSVDSLLQNIVKATHLIAKEEVHLIINMAFNSTNDLIAARTQNHPSCCMNQDIYIATEVQGCYVNRSLLHLHITADYHINKEPMAVLYLFLRACWCLCRSDCIYFGRAGSLLARIFLLLRLDMCLLP